MNDERVDKLMQREKIDNLYKLYDFEKDNEYVGCSVYVYDQGYFNNAEIVIFQDLDSSVISKIKEDYSQLGYTVSVRDGKEYESLKDSLFQGFFRIETSNKKVISEYERFCELQTKKLGGNAYSFIESQYLFNGVLREENILKTIFEQLSAGGPQLVILEAPAGFGKTCTSYEISCMLSKECEGKVPILAELSKNRSARIFSYVLLTEIDRKFPRLSSQVVTEQIREGNIPLIIDGFDELLSKTKNEEEMSLEETKTMLDTIATLFTNGSNAKILLTSRKSSIFTGEIFDNWVEEKLENCVVNRVEILNPTVVDWIGKEKKECLEITGIEIENIANPVLLSMLRSEPLENYSVKFTDAKDILENYFSVLLEREKERQQLLISVVEQKKIMRKLAAMMVQLDISADEADGIQALIEEIVAPNIADYIALYHQELDVEECPPPTEEQFVMKLAHSALLDRVSLNSNYIGFINEFIFGILIGDAVVQGDLSPKELSGKYISLLSTSYAIESRQNREALYSIIIQSDISLNAEQKLALQMRLLGKLDCDYVDEYVSDVIFKSEFVFGEEYTFLNCIFSSCSFEKNIVKSTLFEGCHFIDCVFYDFTAEKVGNPEEESIFISCAGNENLKEALSYKHEEMVEKDNEYYERLVLEQYWMIGSRAAEPRKTHRTLLKGIKQQEKAKVLLAIDSLIDKGILHRLTYCIELDFSQLAEVRRILGR